MGVDNYGALGKLEMGKLLMKRIPCKKKDVVLIGDTDHDFEVAKKLNIDCILVSSGHQSNKRLKSLTNNVIETLSELDL